MPSFPSSSGAVSIPQYPFRRMYIHSFQYRCPRRKVCGHVYTVVGACTLPATANLSGVCMVSHIEGAESATTYLAVVADEHHALAVSADLLGLKAHVEGGFLPGYQIHVEGPHLQGGGRVHRGEGSGLRGHTCREEGEG